MSIEKNKINQLIYKRYYKNTLNGSYARFNAPVLCKLYYNTIRLSALCGDLCDGRPRPRQVRLPCLVATADTDILFYLIRLLASV